MAERTLWDPRAATEPPPPASRGFARKRPDSGFQQAGALSQVPSPAGDVAVTFGVRDGRELLQLLVRLEGVGREVVEGPDRLGALRGQQFPGRNARPERWVTGVLPVGCAHRGPPPGTDRLPPPAYGAPRAGTGLHPR